MGYPARLVLNDAPLHQQRFDPNGFLICSASHPQQPDIAIQEECTQVKRHKGYGNNSMLLVPQCS